MIRFIFLISGLTFSAFASHAASSLQPDRLTCENNEYPLGLDIKKPHFNWTLSSAERNQSQSSFELLVGDNLEEVRQDKGNCWFTGKLSSAQNIQVPYAGKPLQSFHRYYWKVRVYDQANQPSNWSEIHWFEMAMIESTDWKAQWISDGSSPPAREEDFYKEDRMPLFRKRFKSSKKIAAARLYISGLGYYEAYLNGKKIGDHQLDPGFTTYRKRVLYVVHDITSMIRQGENVMGIMLGNGWFNPLPFKFFGRWALRDYQQTGRPCVKAELHLRYADGSEDIFPTDASWQTTPGPVTQNNVYLGEQYDARMEIKNWNSVKTTEAGWTPASLVTGPAGALTPQLQPAIKITRVLKPLRMTEPAKDTFLFDLGQNIAGVARINVKGPVGTRIRIRYGEDVFQDGKLNYLTTCATQIKKGGIKGGPGCPETAWQEDVYTLKGEGIESWSPRFTFHGFRYIELTGWPGRPGLKDVEGLRMNSDLQSNGDFACSNGLFNKIHETVQYTFLSNVFSVQSDCPAREKMGYGGDMVATANAFIYNYDMQEFYRKAINDFSNEQRPQGGITEIAPFTGIADRGYGDDSGPLGWELAFPYLQKQLYEFYGDKEVIAQNYPALKRQMEFLASRAVDHLFYWDISDHEALDTKPESLTASAFYFHHACLAAEFAGILQESADSLRYARLAARIKENMISRFLVKGTGRFDNATQSAQVFALWYHLSPEPDSSFRVLLDECKRHQMHVSTGIFSTKMMFDVFRERNMNGIAYAMANQRSYPGWGFMIGQGATTLWETWAYPESGPSQNHPMFGSIDEWFYRSLLGINPGAPGFEKLILKPQPAGDLRWAKGTYRSVRGKITSDWKIADHHFQFHVSVPAGMRAEIWIPSVDGKVQEQGQPVDKIQGIQWMRFDQGFAILETGSGNYEFSTKIND